MYFIGGKTSGDAGRGVDLDDREGAAAAEGEGFDAVEGLRDGHGAVELDAAAEDAVDGRGELERPPEGRAVQDGLEGRAAEGPVPPEESHARRGLLRQVAARVDTDT